MSGGPALDMTLDDLIKQNQKTPGGGAARGNVRGRGGSGFGPGPSRRFNNRAANRVTPYSAYSAVPQAPEAGWAHDMFASDQAMAYAAQIGAAAAARSSSIETGTKLYISNLDSGVSNEDIKELFAEVGDLKRYSIHYDKSGRSKGTAEVVYSRRPDALAAVKRYNGVQLDGKPMKIEIVGTNIVTPAALPAPVTIPTIVNGAFGGAFNGAFDGAYNGGYNGAYNGAPRSILGRGGSFGRPHGGGGGGRGFGRGFSRGRGFGRGRGRGRDGGEKVSADDLDADLEKYHKAAMETN